MSLPMIEVSKWCCSSDLSKLATVGRSCSGLSRTDFWGISVSDLAMKSTSAVPAAFSSESLLATTGLDGSAGTTDLKHK